MGKNGKLLNFFEKIVFGHDTKFKGFYWKIYIPFSVFYHPLGQFGGIIISILPFCVFTYCILRHSKLIIYTTTQMVAHFFFFFCCFFLSSFNGCRMLFGYSVIYCFFGNNHPKGFEFQFFKDFRMFVKHFSCAYWLFVETFLERGQFRSFAHL